MFLPGTDRGRPLEQMTSTASNSRCPQTPLLPRSMVGTATPRVQHWFCPRLAQEPHDGEQYLTEEARCGTVPSTQSLVQKTEGLQLHITEVEASRGSLKLGDSEGNGVSF